jgi:hypothetical protein
MSAELVPAGTDDCSSSAPFLYLTLSMFGSVLSLEPAVQQYLAGEPGLAEQIRALTVAVSQAGVRVRDGGGLRSDFDDRLRLYTPNEIWLVDLAIDLAVMLGSLDDLPRSTQATLGQEVRDLDRTVHGHQWQHLVRKAGPGPAEFAALRSRVPHHQPHPARTR